MTQFIVLAALLTVLGTGLLLWPLLARRGDHPGAPVAAALTALLVPLAVLGLYLSVSNHDWTGPAVSAGAGQTVAPAMDQAIADLDSRLGFGHTHDPLKYEGQASFSAHIHKRLG